MPINYLREFTHPSRTDEANRRLGCTLTFVAGAVNAEGFLLVGQYTSHMSGIVASLSDNLVLGQVRLVLAALGSLLAFLFGTLTSTVLIHWWRLHHRHSEYAVPLMLEAMLLLSFGIFGGSLDRHDSLFLPGTAASLCYVMGLQNAIITKISKAEIRTTHVTGLVTDIGIELGKLVYLNCLSRLPIEMRITEDRTKLRLLASMLSMFILGGLAGTIGFKQFAFISTIPLAVALVVLAIVPLFDDFSLGAHE